jgi:two-component system, cell cycle sensor histidine kinase and response regulator CckA
MSVAAPSLELSARLSERTALAGGSAAICLGTLGLLGWATPWRWLASFDPTAIPMAPGSALALSFLGGSLILQTRRRLRPLAIVLELLVAALGCAQLVIFWTGLPPMLDRLLVDSPATLGGIPTGQMSPWTALGLLLASFSLLFLRLAARRRTLGSVGASLALAVCAEGVVVTLGYLFDAPLLYGGPVVPMALPSALAFACLGLALIGFAPRGSGPLRPFVGSSARAVMLRAFLPVAPAVVVTELVFELLEAEGMNRALDAALTGLVSAAVTGAIVFYAARRVGGELDLAQVERQNARRDADRLAAIVQSSRDAIYAKSLDGTIVAWNASAERLFGYSQEEALGRKLVVPAGDSGERARILERIGAGQQVDSVETRQLRKDGSVALVALSESPLRDNQGQVVGVSVIARDVGEQKRAETALRQSEAEFRLLAESIPQMVWITQPDGSAVYANRQWMEYTGLTLEETQGDGWTAAFQPEDRQRAVDAWRRAIVTVSSYSLECRIRSAAGEYRWWLIRGVPTRDTGGNLLKWFGTCTDIHDLKLAELKISESEDRFAKVFHSDLVAVSMSQKSTGRVIDVNARLAEFFGYSREEMIGRTVSELGLWADPAARKRAFSAATAGSGLGTEAAFRRKSGEIRHALISIQTIALPGNAEPFDIVLIVDLTERKQLESQLLQAQKLEAVGRLAGGVAHDFNNLLGVILGYTELLLGKASEAQRGKLEQILRATERATGLTRQLLAFSRRQVVAPKSLDLNDLLSHLKRMLGRLLGEDIDLAVVPGADLGCVKADPVQLEQVVMNLCVNARDAMPHGGRLRIETANIEVGAGHDCRHGSIEAGPYVMLAVSDTGCGIEEAHLPHLFEPFFTTKQQDEGSGLGLSMVYGIVTQAGGYVWVTSTVGRGTEFTIYLPRVDEPAAMLAVEETSQPADGCETILLVEDEHSLRALGREILEQHGYSVIAAGNASEAIAMAHRHPQTIHLLLTDVVMPGMNGRALAEMLVAERPALRVLYCSGYTDDVLGRSGVLNSDTLLLEKPFTARAMLAAVRTALAAPCTQVTRVDPAATTGSN